MGLMRFAAISIFAFLTVAALSFRASLASEKTPQPKTYYELFNLSPEATPDEIRNAAVPLINSLHPDRNNGDRSKEELYREAIQAHQTLKDPEKRRKYDEKLFQVTQSHIPYQGAVRSPNRDNPMLTLEEIAKYDWPAFNSKGARQFANSLKTIPRGSVEQMTQLIHDQLEATIIQDMGLQREELNVFDVADEWFYILQNKLNVSIVKPKQYNGLEDYPLYEATYRAYALWLHDLRPFSKDSSDNRLHSLYKSLLAEKKSLLESQKDFRYPKRQASIDKILSFINDPHGKSPASGLALESQAWAKIADINRNSEWTPEIWAKVPDHMVDADPSIRRQVLLKLEQQPNWPREVWAKVPALLKDSNQKISDAMKSALWNRETLGHEAFIALSIGDPTLTDQIIHDLSRWKDWSPQVRDQMIAFLKDPRYQLRALTTMNELPKLSEAVWAEIPALMEHSDPRVKVAVAKLLAQHSADWTPQVRKALPTLIGDPDWQVQKIITEAIIKQQLLCDELWEQMHALLKDSRYHARHAAFKILNSQEQWPKDFLDKTQSLEKELNNDIKAQFVELRKAQLAKQKTSLRNRIGCLLDSVKAFIARP
jgi:curved DNA-binding protein CbpA